jgi:hypothetical protein
MRNLLRGIAWISTLAFCSTLRCAAPVQSTGGSSSETIIGKVVNGDGSPARSTVVTLYPADYDPIGDAPLARSNSDTTDSDGAYSLKAADSSADYSIVATNPGSGTRAFVADIVVSGDTTRAPDAVLSMPGAVSVAVPDSVTAAGAGGYVYIPGTGIAAYANDSGMVLLEELLSPASRLYPTIRSSYPTRSGVIPQDCISIQLLRAREYPAMLPVSPCL